jgi:heme-degrading monooxygenase HmoA
MIVEYIRYTIAGEQAQAFEAAYVRARESLDASAHCLGYELARCVEEPSSYLLRIEWDSLEGHEQGFRGSQEFRQFLPHIRAFVGDIQEMRHYGVVFAHAPREAGP